VAIGASAMGLLPWPLIWMYLGAELVGGALAAVVFKAMNGAEA
jgi:glycerol uptake facilitator-like aquaporin